MRTETSIRKYLSTKESKQEIYRKSGFRAEKLEKNFGKVLGQNVTGNKVLGFRFMGLYLGLYFRKLFGIYLTSP